MKVAEMWNTSLLIPTESMIPALVCVLTPPGADIGKARLALQAEPYNTWIQPGITDQGQNYIRISAQVYLEMSDFVLFAQRFLDLM